MGTRLPRRTRGPRRPHQCDSARRTGGQATRTVGAIVLARLGEVKHLAGRGAPGARNGARPSPGGARAGVVTCAREAKPDWGYVVWKQRTRTWWVTWTVALVAFAAAVTTVLAARLGGTSNPAHREALEAARCFHDIDESVQRYARELDRDPRTADRAAAITEQLAALADETDLPTDGPYGVFENGTTGEEFCADARALFLEANEAWRTMPAPPSPSESPSPSPSPSATSSENGDA